MYNLRLLEREAEKRGWSVSEWARRARVPQATADQLLKRGSGRGKTIEKLAKPLNLTLEDLLPKETSAA